MAHIEQHTSGLDIVVFGGGGGGSVMVGGLVEAMPDANITAIVPTGDSGSKTGVIREVFGGPAIGDARKVLGAVASADARPLFDDDNGRFGAAATTENVKALNEQLLGVIEKHGLDTNVPAAILDEVIEQVGMLPIEAKKGQLGGHTYTNLVLNAIRLRNGGKLTPALAEMHKWVGAPDHVRILPVTEESHNVVMYDKVAKRTLIGEGEADEYTPTDPSQVAVWLEAGKMVNRQIEDPHAAQAYYESRHDRRAPRATLETVGAVALSDINLLSPGSLRTSHEPVLRPDGVSDGMRIQKDRGGLWVAVANLTEEKKGMSLATHLETVQDASSRPVTHLIHNTDIASLPQGEVPLVFDPESFDLGDAVAIGEALVDGHEVKTSANDPIAHLRAKGHHDVWRIADLVTTKIVPDAPNGTPKPDLVAVA